MNPSSYFIPDTAMIMANNMLRDMYREVDSFITHRIPIDIDIVKNDDNYIVFTDMPGVRKENLKVYISRDNELIINGDRDIFLDFVDDATVYNKSKRYSKIQRRVNLPSDIDHNTISASLENGVLRVVIKRQKNKESMKEIRVF